MAVTAANDRNSSDMTVASAPLSLRAIETVIMRSLSNGEPKRPAAIIQEALNQGARSEAVVKEALWSLIGSDVVQITDEYRLVRVK